MTDSLTAAKERTTARAIPCPDCGRPMLGAVISDVEVLGTACPHCGQSFRIVWMTE